MGFMDSIFKKRPAIQLLEKKGVNLSVFTSGMSNEERDLIFDYMEKNLMKVDVEVLAAPLVLTSKFGEISYPLVIRFMNRIFVFMTWMDPWDDETVREMLVLFSLLKRKQYPDASFIVLSPHKIPPTLAYFQGHSPATCFHLMNFMDVMIEPTGESLLKRMVWNFRESFNTTLKYEAQSLLDFDDIATKHFKPIPLQIAHSEPLKCSMLLIKRFLEACLLKETSALYSKTSQQKKKQEDLEILIAGDNFFAVDFWNKVHHDFICQEPFSFHNFTLQIKKIVETLSFMPDSSTFPYFRWIYSMKESYKLKRSELLESFVKGIDMDRLEHISHNREHSDIVFYRLFYCPTCKNYRMEMKKVDPFPVFTLNTFREVAHREASYQGEPDKSGISCFDCGRFLSYQQLEYFILCRFLPDVGKDLHYFADRFVDKKLMSAWKYMTLEGNIRWMGHETKESEFHTHMGRHISIVPLWKLLFHRVNSTNSTDMIAVEDFYYIMLIPPVADKIKAEQVQDITRPLTLSGRNYRQYNLREIESAKLFDESTSYHVWLLEYSHFIVSGTYQALIFFDFERFLEIFNKTLKDLNLNFTVNQDFVYTITRYQFLETLDAKNMVNEIIHSSIHPRENIHLKIGKITREFDQLESFINTVRKIVGEKYKLDYNYKEEKLRVTPPGEERPWTLDVRKYRTKFGVRGRELERAIRTVLMLEDQDLSYCSCGNPAWITVKIKSGQWLSDLSEFEESGIIARPYGDNYIVLHKQCPEHSQYITTQALERWQVDVDTIIQKSDHDSDRNVFDIQIYTSAIEGVPVMGIVGEDSASIALKGTWLRKVIEMHPYILPDVCRLFAPTTDTLIITPQGTPDQVLEKFTQQLVTVQQATIGSTDTINFLNEMKLPQKSQGQIHIRFTSEL